MSRPKRTTLRPVSYDDDDDDGTRADPDFCPPPSSKRVKLTEEEKTKKKAEAKLARIALVQAQKMQDYLASLKARALERREHEQRMMKLHQRHAFFLAFFLDMQLSDRSVRQRMLHPDSGLDTFGGISPFCDVFQLSTGTRSLAMSYRACGGVYARRKLKQQNAILAHFGLNEPTRDFVRACVMTDLFVGLKLCYLQAPPVVKQYASLMDDYKLPLAVLPRLPRTLNSLENVLPGPADLRSVLVPKIAVPNPNPFFLCPVNLWQRENHLCVSTQKTVDIMQTMLLVFHRLGLHTSVAQKLVDAWVNTAGSGVWVCKCGAPLAA